MVVNRYVLLHHLHGIIEDENKISTKTEMKALKNSIYLFLPLLLLISFKGIGQSTEAGDTAKIKLVKAAREIMAAAGSCALITLDEEGRPRARVMDPFNPESDLTVWFGTNTKSRKVSQIKNDPRVTLYYLDSDASGYVMVHGFAQIVDDQKEKEKRWKDEWQAFYPNYPQGYLLIKVSPEWMEVISYTRGIVGDPVTWQPPIVLFNAN